MFKFFYIIINLLFKKNKRIWYLESIYELKSKYSGSILGPFWIVISNLLLITILSIVFSFTFYSDYKNILPKLAIGLIIWNFISTSLNSSCLCLINNTHNLLNYSHSYMTYIIKNNSVNIMVFMHNIFLLVGIIFFYEINLNKNFITLIFTLPLFFANIFFISFFLAILNLRFRDIEQITISLMMVFFYFTPILWDVSLISNTKFELFINFNVFYHLLEIVRLPLIGEPVSFLNLIISSIFLLIISLFCYFLDKQYSKKISLLV